MDFGVTDTHIMVLHCYVCFFPPPIVHIIHEEESIIVFSIGGSIIILNMLHKRVTCL